MLTTHDYSKGDNAWQMTAAALVGLQSIPGLAIMYAGMMKQRWAINSAFMVFYGFAATLVVWVVYVPSSPSARRVVRPLTGPGIVGMRTKCVRLRRNGERPS